MLNVKDKGRIERHRRIRAKISGTPERPRVVVRRSNSNFYAQAIDDASQKTLASCASSDKTFSKKEPAKGKIPVAEKLGEHFAGILTKKGIQKIAFDRGGYLYHGRVKAFADAMRKGGIQF